MRRFCRILLHPVAVVLLLTVGCGTGQNAGGLSDELETTRLQLKKLKHRQNLEREREDLEQQAIAAIERLGGKVECNDDGDAVAVELQGPNNLIVRRLEFLPRVTSVTLRGNFDDTCLGSLTRAAGLERLHVRSGQFSDDGLRRLSDVSGLRHIAFDVGQFTDAGMSHLARLPRLKEVCLPGEYSDESFTQWLGSDSVQTLDSRFRLSTETLQAVGNLQNIRSLHLVGDYAPESLSGLATLHQLTLEGLYDEVQAGKLTTVLPECVVRIQLQSDG